MIKWFLKIQKGIENKKSDVIEWLIFISFLTII